MVLSVPSDVFARHEAHVRVEDERRVGRSSEAFGGPIAKDIGGSEDAVEIGDGCEFGRGPGQEDMENVSIAEEIESAGDGVGQRRVRRSTDRQGKGEAGRKSRAGLQEITAGKRRGAFPEMGVTGRGCTFLKQVLRNRN